MEPILGQACSELASSGTPPRQFGMRADLLSMLMPFFPEENGLTEFSTSIDGHHIQIRSETGEPIATPSDRKLLNLLAGAVASHIRAGLEPSRHVSIDTRALLEALSGDSVIGGSEYQRIVQRLERLMATVIETDAPLGGSYRRRRRFRWIDAFEHDDKTLPGGRRMVGLRITISEDAFAWITRSLGYDLTRESFHALTSSRSSIWRIYEICLASLLQSGGASCRILLSDLRARVPISSELKVFKSRTLRSAFDAISQHPEMSRHILLHLEEKRDATFIETSFSRRARLDRLFVRVDRGPGPLPVLNRILPSASLKPPHIPGVPPLRQGGAS